MAASPRSMYALTKKQSLGIYAIPKTLKQAANDPNNDWGADRILVLNTETPQNPPDPSEVAVMVKLEDFIGVYSPTVPKP